MRPWTGLALALRAPGGDQMGSRFSTYLHPLAGRPLSWHTLSALSQLRPARLVIAAGEDISAEPFAELAVAPEVVRGRGGLRALLADVPAEHDVLVYDAAIVAVGSRIAELAGGEEPRVVVAGGGAVAVWLPSAARAAAADAAGLAELAAVLPEAAAEETGDDIVLVRDRAALAEATMRVRDRVVGRLLEGGVTILLPDTVLVDVDVRVGRDTVIYPGVVLEGQTSIGEETVVGPGCRIVDSWIGSGVELKGWNFVTQTSVRNRAVLEPYVRRGYD